MHGVMVDKSGSESDGSSDHARTTQTSSTICRTPAVPFSTDSSERSNRKTAVLPHFWFVAKVLKGERSILARAVINTIASCLFWIGCLGWVINEATMGTIVFAAGNFFFIFTGVWWGYAADRSFHARYGQGLKVVATESAPTAVLAPGSVAVPFPPRLAIEGPEIVTAFRVLALFEIFGASSQVIGGLLFNLGCLTSFWGEEWASETIAFWSVGSGFFLLQGIISQITAHSFLGPRLPLWPQFPRLKKIILKQMENGNPIAQPLTAITPVLPCCAHRGWCLHQCLPSAFLNTTGSGLYVLGSICLGYTRSASAGAWLYCLGSVLYVLANLSDTLAFLDILAKRSLKFYYLERQKRYHKR